MITIWAFLDAPEEYQQLSGHGGDEDWIIHCPVKFREYDWPFELPSIVRGDDDYAMGWGFVERHILDNGDMVIIFAHA